MSEPGDFKSSVNYVKPPPKNRYVEAFSRFYSTKIPMGVREFVFTGPLLLITFAIAYFIPVLIPLDNVTQPANTQKMTEYTLEPIYDEKGGIKGYRHINNRSV
ncbi:hypothetical protein AGDE_03080 [Angomonas deanei]|uniref:Uncharacterized protein n=1 Tax=Angomonas deanei TaxID=59799 RepID=A0A7G2CAF7_9TRYP|nr:hypothetical protein AGDE_03080 [Angomonas deanei]CAD2216435.1 hypothetical protein, conserved [Angomonas deanei]|eukprot:EPY40846.1 hypothetical protein AGDE_03080 [Angomonas deanei]